MTFIVGPVTGAALGASSDVIALSIAAGVIKSIAIMIVTPLVAKAAGLNSPAAAIVYGGLMGSPLAAWRQGWRRLTRNLYLMAQ